MNASQAPAPSDELVALLNCDAADRLGGLFLSNGDFIEVYKPRMLHILYVENNSRSHLEAAATILAIRAKVDGQSRNVAYYLNLLIDDFTAASQLFNKK